MKVKQSTGAILLAVVLVLSIGVVAGAASEVYQIDADHEIDKPAAIADYSSEGHVSGSVDGLDATISIAESKDDLGRDSLETVRPSDAAHDFIRLEYREDIDRTLRIRIPADYFTPYTREGVAAIDTDDVADYTPVRDGEYLQIVVTVDGATDLVLPIHKHSSATYSIISRYEERVEEIAGGTGEWEYLDRDQIEGQHAVEVSAAPEEIVVQHDATPTEPEETWVNTPRGSEGPDGVYWYSPDSEDGDVVYVVAKGGEDAPDVRVAKEGGWRDELEGHVNDAKQIPDRIREGLDVSLEDII